jgi:glutamine amidotransferase
MAKQVCLVDAGTGNLRSVQHALLTLGADVLRTEDSNDIKTAGCLVLPGVGAFGKFMNGLQALDLVDAIREAVKRGVPTLGICVGMQAFFDVGLEMGEFPGLGLLPGRVIKFPATLGVKVPQTGWNQILPQHSNPLLKGLEDNAYAYFNHSYYCAPLDPADVLAETDYGFRFASVVQRDNLFGVQFHPEKSQRTGLTLLSNFLNLN